VTIRIALLVSLLAAGCSPAPTVPQPAAPPPRVIPQLPPLTEASASNFISRSSR
jgi:hypothetical protein